jgi:PTH1 family peptidyl-tRNA hydrolase
LPRRPFREHPRADSETRKKQGQARIGQVEIAGEEVVLARPQTHMNRSGEAVYRLAERYNINPEDLLVIHDDLDLPLGKIRLRPDGSSGGHKGIESIIYHLDNPDFYRLKIGIGRPDTVAVSPAEKEDEVIRYVLSDFSPDEQAIITGAIQAAADAVRCWLSEGPTAAMNRYN